MKVVSVSKSQIRIWILTISTHTDSQTFFESTILASITIQPDDQTFPVSQTAIFNLFLNTASKEPLKEEETFDCEVNKLDTNGLDLWNKLYGQAKMIESD